MILEADSLFSPSLHLHYEISLLLWLLLTSHRSLLLQVTLRSVLYLVFLSMRPPRRRCDNFPLVKPPNLLFRHVRWLEFLFVLKGHPDWQPYIWFLFVGPRLCPVIVFITIQLPSINTSRYLSCLRLALCFMSPYTRNGLSPFSYHPCRAYKKKKLHILKWTL